MTAVAIKAEQPAGAASTGKGKWITCDMIAFEQNRLLFALFRKAGVDYNDPAGKDVVLCHVHGATGRRASLSQLSLGERLELIRRLAAAWKMEAVTIGVPKRLRTWRKGDRPNGYTRKEIPAGTPLARQKRYILGLWLELGYEPGHIDERVRRQFGVERLEWLNDEADVQTLTKDIWKRCLAAGITPEPHA